VKLVKTGKLGLSM